jgi:heme-degrading monooxygenase HmoA
MIVRTWHGCVPLQHATGFAAHLQHTGVEHAQSISGNLGAFVRQETQGEWEHFFLATYWESLAAIRQFAGDDMQRAVTYPDDEQFDLISDPYVFQHDVQQIQALT